MPDVVRYAKTAKGQEEITNRRSNLRGKLRTMLILVDVGKSAEDLRAQAALVGVPPDFLDTLAAEGYIAPLSAVPVAGAVGHDPAVAASITHDELARFREAKSFMNETAVSLLGLRAFLFTLRLERCATRADLAGLVPDYDKALRKAAPLPEAQLMVERVREMLQ